MKKVFLLPVLLFLLVGCQKSQDQMMEEARKAREERLAKINAKVESDLQRLAWIPEGFTMWESGNEIAYRQIKAKCGSYPCIDYEVVTKNGCPNTLYMKMTIEDGSGRNRGFTNDSTSGVRAGQVAVLRMEMYQDISGGGGFISEIICS